MNKFKENNRIIPVYDFDLIMELTLGKLEIFASHSPHLDGFISNYITFNIIEFTLDDEDNTVNHKTLHEFKFGVNNLGIIIKRLHLKANKQDDITQRIILHKDEGYNVAIDFAWRFYYTTDKDSNFDEEHSWIEELNKWNIYYIMEFVITVPSIEAQKVDSHNKLEKFVTRLDKPIELDRNKSYLIGLDSGIMHYTWHNISPDYNNYKIEYKASENDPYRTVTFKPGMFDYGDIEGYIDEWLITKSVITNKDIKRRIDDKLPIAIECNLATYLCTLNLDSGYNIKFNKEFGNLIGFEPGEYSAKNTGTKSPDITNSLDYLYIHCDLTSESIVDGKYGDVLQMVPLSDKERSYPFIIEPRTVSYHLLNTSAISSIKIYITDLLGIIINLNDVHTSFNLMIKKIA